MKRRTLVRLAASAAALLPASRLVALAQDAGLSASSLATLDAVASAVLPASLGRRGVAGITERFLAWLRGYRQGEVLDHGYGRPEVRRSPVSPASRYAEDLAALERAAQEQGAALARLPADTRRTLIEAALRSVGVEGLPGGPNGKHVVSDLMAFYFQSSEANDHCYRARIGRETCRPLPVVAARPKPLA